jgi:hypothetical protein
MYYDYQSFLGLIKTGEKSNQKALSIFAKLTMGNLRYVEENYKTIQTNYRYVDYSYVSASWYGDQPDYNMMGLGCYYYDIYRVQIKNLT